MKDRSEYLKEVIEHLAKLMNISIGHATNVVDDRCYMMEESRAIGESACKCAQQIAAIQHHN